MLTTRSPRLSGSLKPTQTVRDFADPATGATVVARTIYPSAPSGGWPGTPATIREWLITPKGAQASRSCTVEEIAAFEARLGEWSNPRIRNHQTLGLVSEAPTNDREHLQAHLKMATGKRFDTTDEDLVAGLFYLFARATKHTTAYVIKSHSALIVTLMSTQHAQTLDD